MIGNLFLGRVPKASPESLICQWESLVLPFILCWTEYLTTIWALFLKVIPNVAVFWRENVKYASKCDSQGSDLFLRAQLNFCKRGQQCIERIEPSAYHQRLREQWYALWSSRECWNINPEARTIVVGCVLSLVCHHFSKTEGSIGFKRYIRGTDSAKDAPNTMTTVSDLRSFGPAFLWWPQCTSRPLQWFVVCPGYGAFDIGVLPRKIWHISAHQKIPYTHGGPSQYWL